MNGFATDSSDDDDDEDDDDDDDDDPRTCVFLPHRWNDEAPYIDCIQLKWLTGVCEINARTLLMIQDSPYHPKIQC